MQRRLRRRFQTWLDARIPPANEVVLRQRQIFILPTGLGGGYVLSAFLLYIAGINYNNAMILGFSYLLFSLFIITILHTFSNLAGLEIAAGRVEPNFAGKECRFEIKLRQRRQRAHRALRFHWREFSSMRVDVAGHEISLDCLLKSHQRGLMRPGRLRVESDFPLGLCRAWSWIDLDMSCPVYPRQASVPEHLLQQGGSKQVDGAISRRVGEDEFIGHRAFQIGDTPRQVDWRATARSGTVLTKLFFEAPNDEIWLDYDQMPGSSSEARLSQLCYLVLRASLTEQPYGLRLPTATVALGQGQTHEKRCLTALAEY